MPLAFTTPLRVTANLVPASGAPRPGTLTLAALTAACVEAGVLEVAVTGTPDRFAAEAGAVAELARSAELDVRLPAAFWSGAQDLGGDLAGLEAAWRSAGVSRLAVTLDFTALLDRPAEWGPRLDSLAASAATWPGWRAAAGAAPEGVSLPAALELASAAASAGLRRILLLPPDLVSTGSRPASAFNWHEFRHQPAWRPPEGVELVVHDYFLHRLLGGSPPASGGCQAAGALAHVDAAGTVYPCSALPLPLGRLTEDDFTALWSGSSRLEVRRRLDEPVRACLGCPRAESCRGGCRGLAYLANRRWDERDPGCPG